MVMGVNPVNLSTNLKNPAANTNARVSYPVPFRSESRMFQEERTSPGTCNNHPTRSLAIKAYIRCST